MTTPISLRGRLEWRPQAIEMKSSITIVAEEQLIVIFACATNRTGLALDALPTMPFCRSNHVRSELQTAWMGGAATIMAGNQIFWPFVLLGISLFSNKAEVAIFTDLQ